MSRELVEVAREARVARVTLQRPERLNAVTEELYEQLLDALNRVARDPAVRVVVLAGAGRAFCAGADLRRHAEAPRGPAQRRDYVWLAVQVSRTLMTLPKPVIARIHGYAFGAGMELALSADFLVVANDAVLGFPELSLGTYFGGGVTWRLPRLIGQARAAELLLLGRRFTGADARSLGLAYAAVDPAELDGTVAELATALGEQAPIPLAALKRQLADPPQSLWEALASEAETLLHCMTTADWAEGATAFADKRQPRFEGR
ncbi:MAG TPA: enoyl-CoA hydratase-related protein [Actinomycetes bacterium]|nr:enoyl-CoA hydratase-related protein [Actinomycetes bacterium]